MRHWQKIVPVQSIWKDSWSKQDKNLSNKGCWMKNFVRKLNALKVNQKNYITNCKWKILYSLLIFAYLVIVWLKPISVFQPHNNLTFFKKRRLTIVSKINNYVGKLQTNVFIELGKTAKNTHHFSLIVEFYFSTQCLSFIVHLFYFIICISIRYVHVHVSLSF